MCVCIIYLINNSIETWAQVENGHVPQQVGLGGVALGEGLDGRKSLDTLFLLCPSAHVPNLYLYRLSVHLNVYAPPTTYRSCTCVCVCVGMCGWVGGWVGGWVSECVCTHTYTHTCIHTYMQTSTHTCQKSSPLEHSNIPRQTAVKLWGDARSDVEENRSF